MIIAMDIMINYNYLKIMKLLYYISYSATVFYKKMTEQEEPSKHFPFLSHQSHIMA